MALDLHKLKQVDDSAKHLIWGYCTEVRNQVLPPNNAYYDIQDLMKFTVLAYYHQDIIQSSDISISYNSYTRREASAPSEHSYPPRSKRSWELSPSECIEWHLQYIDDKIEELENPDWEREELLDLKLNLWDGKYSKRAFKVAIATNII